MRWQEIADKCALGIRSFILTVSEVRKSAYNIVGLKYVYFSTCLSQSRSSRSSI